MLNLKAKLAAAGVLPKKDEQQHKGQGKKPGAKGRKPADRSKTTGRRKIKGKVGPQPRLPNRLKDSPRNELYEAVRRFVQRFRLDRSEALPGPNAQRFHFSHENGRLNSLFLEPDAHKKVSEGAAGIVSYMSHHGLAHCVLPKEAALEVAKLRPLWLRVLKDHPLAGQIAKAETKNKASEDNTQASAPETTPKLGPEPAPKLGPDLGDDKT